MDITLEMILTRFFLDYPESSADYKKTDNTFLGIHLLPKNPDTPTPDYLYVSDCYEEILLSKISSSVTVICFSEQADVTSAFSNVIILHSDLELAEGFNGLQKSFNDFVDWGRQLDFAVFRNASFQEMIALSTPILPSPVLVYDPALKLLAYSPNHETLKDPLFQNAVKNGYLDIETVKYLEQTKSFEQINLSGSTKGEADSYRGHADFIQTININNELAVYCVLLYTDDFSHSYVYQLFRILCEAFRKLLEKQHSTFLRDRSVTDYFLMDLLDNPDTSKEQIRERIYFNDLDYEGYFCLLSVYSDVKKKSAEKYFIQYLRNNMINCRIFSYRESIVILYHLPKSSSVSYKNYLAGQLRRVFHDFSGNRIRVYVSKPFFTIGDFSDAYAQAENTRKIRASFFQKYDPDFFPMDNAGSEEPVFFFEDYWTVDLLYQNPVKNKTSFYCEPCLLDLLKKNTKKSRRHLRILYEYLNHDRNYTSVAQKLDMHRNNVIYHIKSLEEQYQLDLDQPSVRLKLLLSFEILFYTNEIDLFTDTGKE